MPARSVACCPGLDPPPADADAFKELQVGTQGQFGGLGIEKSAWRTASSGDLADRGYARVSCR